RDDCSRTVVLSEELPLLFVIIKACRNSLLVNDSALEVILVTTATLVGAFSEGKRTPAGPPRGSTSTHYKNCYGFLVNLIKKSRCRSGRQPILEPEILGSKRAPLSVPFVQLLEHLQASTEPPLPRPHGRAALQV
ncbi:hypothetical protein MTO96_023788, partial [Rhipicephalus appendiculatus]